MAAVIRCKAKAKSTRRRCEKRGKNVCASCRVCRVHGCNCSNPGGAPKGSQNRMIHGIYAVALSTEEIEIYADIDIAGLDHEIRVAKIMLRRALLAQAESDRATVTIQQLGRGGDPITLALELRKFEQSAVGSTSPDAKDGAGTSVKKVLERRDYWTEIHRFLGRIERLSSTRAAMGGNAGIDANATAREIQDALRQMDELTHGGAD